MHETTNKVAFVTGVGDGTGAAVARRFAEGGYRVAMLARNEERLAKANIPGPSSESRSNAIMHAVRTHLEFRSLNSSSGFDLLCRHLGRLPLNKRPFVRNSDCG